MTIEIRTSPIQLELREDGEGRTLVGLAVPYDKEARIGSYTEVFRRGSFADIQDVVPLLAVHDRESLPIGVATSLEDTAPGLAVELRVSRTKAGDDALELVKDGALSGLSVGFTPIEDKWSANRSRVERIKARLVELSLTSFPAYADARILAVRTGETDAPERTPRLTVARYRL